MEILTQAVSTAKTLQDSPKTSERKALVKVKINSTHAKFVREQGRTAVIRENTQRIYHSIYTSNMDQVVKAAKSTTKSNGMLAGALVLLVGTVGAAMDAAVQVSTNGHNLLQATMWRARHQRAKHQPLAEWRTVGKSKFVVVDPWQIDILAKIACHNTAACVKKFKALTWKEIRKKAGKHPIVRIIQPPKNLVRIQFTRVSVPKK